MTTLSLSTSRTSETKTEKSGRMSAVCAAKSRALPLKHTSCYSKEVNVNKTHEVCSTCKRWLALKNPHIEAIGLGGKSHYFHTYCVDYYEYPLTEKRYVNTEDPAVCGGGS